MSGDFARALLAWWDRDGRKDLPWQRKPTPYRVWVSEIMLQQTQVKTVIPYYQRFMRQFPSLAALAAAPGDDVLAHWSGLGYYARARNLHAAAKQVTERFGGRFPDRIEDVLSLPGIGRSTAGAILALAKNQRHPILDGNVKRVLARHNAVESFPGESRTLALLWEIAEEHTPADRPAAYTQAIMDLGATVCTRSKPTCLLCPVRETCQAFARGLTGQLPAPRPRRERPSREAMFLAIVDAGARIYLERRPPTGIWGGLWCLPELATDADIHLWLADTLGARAESVAPLPTVQHGFTHYRLEMRPVLARLGEGWDAGHGRIAERAGADWFELDGNGIGLPAPVSAILERVARELEQARNI